MAASAIDKENESVKEQKIRFKKVVESELEGTDPKVVEIIKEEFAKLWGEGLLVGVGNGSIARFTGYKSFSI